MQVGVGRDGYGNLIEAEGIVPVSSSGIPLGGPYTKAALITPGTPVAAGGRGVWIDAPNVGAIILKFSGGGQIRYYLLGSGNFRIDGFGVVDVDVTNAPGTAVTVLY